MSNRKPRKLDQDFPPGVPKYLIDDLLRHPQWSHLYNETLLEINDVMADFPPVVTTVPPPPTPPAQPQHHYQPQPQYHQPHQFQALPVQSVQPGLIQGQGVQVGHLPGVQVDLQGVNVDHRQPSQGRGHRGGQTFGQSHHTGGQNFNQQQGMGQQSRMAQGQGQMTYQTNNQQQGMGPIGQMIQRGHSQNGMTFQLDPFTAMSSNIQVDPIQSFNLGHGNNMHTGPVDLGHHQVISHTGPVDLGHRQVISTQQFHNPSGQQNLQIVSARETNSLRWK